MTPVRVPLLVPSDEVFPKLSDAQIRRCASRTVYQQVPKSDSA